MSEFSGTIQVKIEVGMEVRIDPSETAGKIHKGKTFVIAGQPRELCGTEVVALNNLDGSRFSAAYDLSMLQVTDATAKHIKFGQVAS